MNRLVSILLFVCLAIVCLLTVYSSHRSDSVMSWPELDDYWSSSSASSSSNTSGHQGIRKIVSNSNGQSASKTANRILCLVVNKADNDARAMAIMETWGKRCDGFALVSTKRRNGWRTVTVPRTESRKILWPKVQALIRYSYKHLHDYDWFLKADDDTYVIVENLRHFLSNQSTNEPLYYGAEFVQKMEGGFLSGGAGYVFSRRAIQLLVEEGFRTKRCNLLDHEVEELRLEECARLVGVQHSGETVDEQGRGRFFPYAPERHFSPGNEDLQGWLKHRLGNKLDCCSDSAISFHYIRPINIHLRRGKSEIIMDRTYSAILMLTVLQSVMNEQQRVLQVEVVSLGTVATTSTTSLAFTAAAMETALEEFAETEYIGVLNMTLTLLYNSSIVDDDAMPDYSDDMLAKWYYLTRLENVHVAVIVLPGGPEDLPTNYLAKNWNVLLITCGSSRANIKNKVESPTWVTTTSFSASLATEVYGDLVAKYNWSSLFVVLDHASSPVFHSAADAIVEHFELLPGFQLTSAMLDCSKKEENLRTLELFPKISRVLLFFGHAEPFRTFMIHAHSVNRTGKDYVYVVLEPYHHNIIGNFTWQHFDQHDEAAYEAFQSVLLLAPDDPALHQGSEAAHFSRKWRNMTLTAFNYTYAEGEMFVPTVASSHYTMDFLAMALKESMEIDDFDFANGTALAQHFMNRSFQVDGEDFFMDQYGRRQVKWRCSYFDNETGQFVPFLERNDKLQQLLDVAPVVWYRGNILPPNEPICGFLGFRKACRPPEDRTWVSGVVATVCCILLIPVGTYAIWRLCLKQARSKWWLIDGLRLLDMAHNRSVIHLR
ncbi:putative Glycoprotein-N-acetylgalactosamine 3-beta-galactosyltransferase 1 [Hypsibius exemplaris]|uniref:N-acetylgalactosaminide beta-1,3-galactosyltransferase n=1 Tax=Hypsibius exemplaris TaxID=2072580 RepID=A0A1W0WUJ4_HYPEX|nr:putative Glycoprotein-N-acetylgalactosamine 3-beta-galactosyltransferase 1 [Hypsibius exemplaris]